MILIIETADDAAAALVALRSWIQESPEVKLGVSYGARRNAAEQLHEDILASLRTFRRLRKVLDKTSGTPTPPDGTSRDDVGSRDARTSPVAPQRAASSR